MKMKKVQVFQLLVAALALVVVSCGSPSKMLKNASVVRYRVSPNPMEMKGDSVEVRVSGTYPAKYFLKKAEMEITPVIKWDGGSLTLQSKKLRGEKIQSNGTMISNKTGGSFAYTVKVPYQEGMMQSQLYVNSVVKMKSKSLALPEVKVGNGVLATPTLLVNDQKMIVVPTMLNKDVASKEASIMYVIAQAKVVSSESVKSQIEGIKAFVKQATADKTTSIKSVVIQGYSSPDGSEKFNAMLAKKREAAAVATMKSQLKTKNIVSSSVSEDWDGFQQLLSASSIQDKQAILDILSRISDPAEREVEIKKMSVVYQEIAKEILPQLRRSKVVVNLQKNIKADSILVNAALGKNKVVLTQDEYLLATTLASSKEEAITMLQNATVALPTNWVIFNNLGCANIASANYDAAASALAKADELSQGDAAVKNNLGVLAIKQGKIAEGIQYFESAQSSGTEASYNLAVAKVKAGDYENALSLFGSSATCNVALAKILVGNLDGALETLASAKDADLAVASYLKAIVAARNKDLEAMMTNLVVAVEKDATLRERAKKDLEFAVFAQEENFKALIK